MTAAVEFAGLSLREPVVMGIINVTPDSFSDGGEAYALEDAVIQARAMHAAGAAILDVGGESTRPGSDPVDVEEELRRVVPVVSALAADGLLVSIDTRRAAVMAAAVEAGARITNDVTALTGDADSLATAARLGVPVVLMHMQGEPGTMQDDPRYDDAPRDVADYLAGRIAACEAAGIPRSHIAVDPGIGFGKTLQHNLQILARLDLYREMGCPVVLGVSRKSFIGRIADAAEPKARVPGSLAAAMSARGQGVQIFRVHDVAETAQALAVFDAIQDAGGEGPGGP